MNMLTSISTQPFFMLSKKRSRFLPHFCDSDRKNSWF